MEWKPRRASHAWWLVGIACIDAICAASDECESFRECIGRAALLSSVPLGSPDWHSAKRLYERATELRPDSKEAWLGRGALSQDSGDLVPAADQLSRALALDPLCWRAGINVGNLAARQGDLQTALRAFQHVIRTNPFVPQAFYSRGFVELLQGRLKVACACFQRAWALKPDLHTIAGFRFALDGLQSLRDALSPDRLCPIPGIDGDGGGVNDVGEIVSMWEEAYMRGDGREECSDLRINLATFIPPLRGGAGRSGGWGAARNERKTMEVLRDFVGRMHALYGPDCDGLVSLHVVTDQVLPARQLAEISLWDHVRVHTIPADSVERADGGEWARKVREMQEQGVLPDELVAVDVEAVASSNSGRQALQKLQEAARRAADGFSWAGESVSAPQTLGRGARGTGQAEALEVGGGQRCYAWAFGSVSGKGSSAGGAGGRECPLVVGQGLSSPSRCADVVVLTWGPVGGQGATRVASILRQNRLEAAVPDYLSAGLGEVRRAVDKARVVVVVVERAGGRWESGQEAEYSQDICQLLGGVGTQHRPRNWGKDGSGASAVFGLVLDGAVKPLCMEGGGWAGSVQWYERRWPLQTSIAMEQDLDDVHNLTPLVSPAGMLLLTHAPVCAYAHHVMSISVNRLIHSPSLSVSMPVCRLSGVRRPGTRTNAHGRTPTHATTHEHAHAHTDIYRLTQWECCCGPRRIAPRLLHPIVMSGTFGLLPLYTY